MFFVVFVVQSLLISVSSVSSVVDKFLNLFIAFIDFFGWLRIVKLAMKLELECFACILDDVLEAGALLLNTRDLEELARQSVGILAGADPAKTPSVYITRVHRKLKELAHDPEPFLEKRRQCNWVGNRIATRIGQTVPSNYAGFKRLLRWVVWSNTLDFRTAGKGYRFSPKKIEADLRRNIKKGLAVDDRPKIWRTLRHARKILYILDNVGEIAFDKIFIRKFFTDKEVVACVRGGVLTSDATVSDLSDIGFDSLVSRVIRSGPDTLGVIMEEISQELLDALESSDLVISKGQANFYFFSRYPNVTKAPVACFFTTKCAPVSRCFKKSGKIAVAKIIKS